MSNEVGATPFDNPILRDWLLSPIRVESQPPKLVSCFGEGPFTEDDFDEFLINNKSQNAWVVYEAFGEPHPHSVQYVILGREGWDAKALDELIDSRIGTSLRVYSQEMFVAYVIRNEDPFYGGPEVLEAFQTGHPGLEFLSEGWPGWVSSYVFGDWRFGRPLELDESPDVGPLKILGYVVGANGKPQDERRRILETAFKGPLPIVQSLEYMQDWGAPKSRERLEKLANSIAAFSRNAKRNSNRMKQAIGDWDSDLRWMEQEFYRGHFRFQWPNTYVH